MSALAASVGEVHRQRVLRALGLTPWVRRGTPPVAAGMALESPSVAAGAPACVLVLPAGCPPRALDLLGRALHGFGPWLARAARIEVRDGRLEQVPRVAAYLVFGQAQAQALGRELPAAVAAQAQIVLVEPPQALLEGAGKRQLWIALRRLRRAMGGTG